MHVAEAVLFRNFVFFDRGIVVTSIDQIGIRNVQRVRRMRYAMGMLLALIPAAGYASEPLTFLGFDKASHSATAHEGMEEIFSGRCFHGAIPVSVVKALEAAKAESPSELGYDPDSPNGQYYSSDKIPSPPERTGGMALGESVFERNGAILANGNCFGCHAGIVNGQVVAGLGNNRKVPSGRSNGAKNRPNVFQLLSVLSGDAEKAEFKEVMVGMQAMHLALPDAPSRGDNFGPFAVWNVGARLADPEKTGLQVGKEKTELVKLIETTMVPTVDPMAWWLMKYKKRDYWYSDGGIEDAAHFSFNFTTTHSAVNDNHAAHVASTAKALAFARETQSPLFPESLDATLVKKGADLFHGRTKPMDRKGFVTCKTCHGTYTKKASQPDLGKPGSWSVSYKGSESLRNVKTDGAYNATLQKFKPIVDHINKLAAYYDAKGTPELTPRVSVPSKKGYVPPPLVGVWASAPYFHNGSVPTITAVLNSSERPGIWSREISDPHAYDLENVGLKFQLLSRSDFEASATEAASAHPSSKASIEHLSIYDTEGFGHGNMGHTFGDRLATDERTAVIEFLKSLSGPDM